MAARQLPKAPEKAGKVEIHIKPMQMAYVDVEIEGVSDYVQHRFSTKAQQILHQKHASGQQAGNRRNREPKDFQANYLASMYETKKGERGIPADCFRKAAISACRLVNFKMTIAKLSIFVEANGFDKDDGRPLVLFTKGTPEYFETYARNSNGEPDLRARGRWVPGWRAVVRVRYDSSQFSAEDVYNLFARIGLQVGIGEGRPDSKESAGMGWGLFQIAGSKEVRK